MKLMTLRRLAVQVVVVFVALVAVLTSGAPAQSLADVARQEQARKKDGNVKTYTNENLVSSPAPATTSPAAPSTAAGGDAKADAKTDGKTDAKADGKTDAKADAK